MCDCVVCVRNRVLRECKVPDDIVDHLENLEMDNDYYKAILEGHWPSGKIILEEALKKYD